MILAPITCILIGCLQDFPFHTIKPSGRGIEISFPKPVVTNSLTYTYSGVKEKSCYLDGIFYPNCKDTESKIVWHYHNQLKSR